MQDNLFPHWFYDWSILLSSVLRFLWDISPLAAVNSVLPVSTNPKAVLPLSEILLQWEGCNYNSILLSKARILIVLQALSSKEVLTSQRNSLLWSEKYVYDVIEGNFIAIKSLFLTELPSILTSIFLVIILASEALRIKALL